MVVIRQLSYAMWSRHGICHHLLISRGIVWELVDTPRPLVILLLVELVATILSPRVMAFVGLDGLKVKATIVNPIP